MATSKKDESNENVSIITGALSGTTGGALLGAPLGIFGSVIGGIVAGAVTGYSVYYRSKITKNGRTYKIREK